MSVACIQLINYLYLSCSELLLPFSEFLLYLLFDLVLSVLEHGVVSIIVLMSGQLDLLRFHIRIHVHEDVDFEADLFRDFFFLADVMSFVGTEEGTLRAHSLLIRHTNEL